MTASRTSATGVVMSTYVRAGEVETGSFESIAPSAEELARREAMAAGTW